MMTTAPRSSAMRENERKGEGIERREGQTDRRMLGGGARVEAPRHSSRARGPPAGELPTRVGLSLSFFFPEKLEDDEESFAPSGRRSQPPRVPPHLANRPIFIYQRALNSSVSTCTHQYRCSGPVSFLISFFLFVFSPTHSRARIPPGFIFANLFLQ